MLGASRAEQRAERTHVREHAAQARGVLSVVHRATADAV